VTLPPLICVVGPTASGKTALALRLAEQTNGEIISADSVQIYRYFDIGSGKPTAAELARVPHHLLSAIDPHTEMDASLFAAAAVELIEGVRSRGRTPIVCGGTYLWVKALLYGLAPAPPQNAAIREQHRQFVETQGRPALHQKLLSIDPTTAARLMPNDFVRVSRALEVYELTGRPMSAFLAEHGFREPRYDAQLIGVQHAHEALHQRIHARVTEMFAMGWLEEVRALSDAGYAETRPMKSVGYRQVLEAVKSGRVLDASLIEDVARVTRIFARRQRTWLRDIGVQWLSQESAAEFTAPAEWYQP
jgi:tRNA dimethylallyltransferase